MNASLYLSLSPNRAAEKQTIKRLIEAQSPDLEWSPLPYAEDGWFPNDPSLIKGSAWEITSYQFRLKLQKVVNTSGKNIFNVKNKAPRAVGFENGIWHLKIALIEIKKAISQFIAPHYE